MKKDKEGSGSYTYLAKRYEHYKNSISICACMRVRGGGEPGKMRATALPNRQIRKINGLVELGRII